MRMRYNAKNMWKSCLKKVAFKSYEKALKRAEKYNQRVYYCFLCGKYHLTKTRKEK